MSNRIKPMLIASMATLLAASSPGYAGGFSGRLGIDGGGDKLVRLQFTDGETSSIKAGGGFFFEVGYALTTPGLGNPALTTEATFGYKNDSESASNGDIDFTRLSLNLNQFYTLDTIRVGAGATFHFNNELNTSGSFFTGRDLAFEDTAGFNLMVEYIASDKVVVGMRATFIEYNFEDSAFGTDAIDGNSFGLYMGANY